MAQVAMIIGTAVSAIGMLQAGASAEAAANRNAGVLFQNANASRLAANENAKRQARAGRKRIGQIRAWAPFAMDVIEDQAIEEELAVQSFVHAGEVQAVGLENRAQLEIARGRSARQSSRLGALATVLIGGAQAFGAGGGGFGSTATTNAIPGSVGAPVGMFSGFPSGLSPGPSRWWSGGSVGI